MDKNYVKIPAVMNSNVSLKVIRGHFATSHSHINCFFDITTMKTRCSEAHNVASLLAMHYSVDTQVDTIICMDGTEVIGTYLAEELTKSEFFRSTRTRPSILYLRNTSRRDRLFSATTCRLLYAESTYCFFWVPLRQAALWRRFWKVYAITAPPSAAHAPSSAQWTKSRASKSPLPSMHLTYRNTNHTRPANARSARRKFRSTHS
jgi:hypothetical protein